MLAWKISLAESEVVCSTIRPTYRLSYDNATELLSMNLKEEGDLHMLAEVANLRHEWRKGQVYIHSWYDYQGWQLFLLLCSVIQMQKHLTIPILNGHLLICIVKPGCY
jgi:hypothetical protein